MQFILLYMEMHDFLSGRNLYYVKKQQEINLELLWITEGAIFGGKKKKSEKMRIILSRHEF